MSLRLTVDGAGGAATCSPPRPPPGIVPVAKGNGYGFTSAGWRAACSGWPSTPSGTGARLDLLAVGTYDELGEAATRYDGDLLVLTPWRPFGGAVEVPDARTATASCTPSAGPRTSAPSPTRDPQRPLRARAAHLDAPPRHEPPRARVEAAPRCVASAAGLRGVALHMPLNTASHLGEVTRLVNDVVAAGIDTHTVFVSHLTRGELAALRHDVPRLHLPPAHRHRPVARRPRRAVGDVHGPRRAPARARRGLRLPAAQRRPSTATCSWSAAAPRTASASRRRAATSRSRRARRPWPAAAWTRSASCARRSPSTASSASSPSRRTCRPRCCSCPQARGCPPSARTSTSGSRFTATDFDTRRRLLSGGRAEHGRDQPQPGPADEPAGPPPVGPGVAAAGGGERLAEVPPQQREVRHLAGLPHQQVAPARHGERGQGQQDAARYDGADAGRRRSVPASARGCRARPARGGWPARRDQPPRRQPRERPAPGHGQHRRPGEVGVAGLLDQQPHRADVDAVEVAPARRRPGQGHHDVRRQVAASHARRPDRRRLATQRR